jgi:AraC-like DNA-binding protein
LYRQKSQSNPRIKASKEYNGVPGGEFSNPKLSVEELSSHLAMSRNSLYTKLLELTGETPRSTHSFTKAGKSSRFIGEEQDDRSSNGFLRWIFYAELFRQII